MKFFVKHKKAVTIIAVILLVILAALGGTALTVYWKVKSMVDSTHRIEDVNMPELENSNISPEAQEDMEGYWNIALFGLDSRNGDLGSGNNSDVEMICSINRATGEIRLVSVYRDTYLKVGSKQYNKINAAYAIGGPSRAISALSENLDMSFDDYASFNWKAVAEAINILGGIDIDITKDEFKLINGFITETVKSTGIGSYQLTHAGMNHLDGVQAVAYARLRKLDTDFQRTERQRTVLAKAMEKAKKADFSVINNIMVVVLPEISTSIDMNDIIPMAKNLSRYHLGKTTGFPFNHVEKNIGTKDCVVPKNLEADVAQLHEFLFDKSYTPSKHVKEISDRIALDSKNGGSGSSGTKDNGNSKPVETLPSLEETMESLESESEEVLHPDGVNGGPGVTITKPAAGETSGGGHGGPGETTAPGTSNGPGETTKAEEESGSSETTGPGVTAASKEAAATSEAAPHPTEAVTPSAEPTAPVESTTAPAEGAAAPPETQGPANSTQAPAQTAATTQAIQPFGPG